jgi:polysaccharide chain length determinant protein (PEP-CTERM system associated)
MNVESGFQPSDILGIARRRAKPAAATALLATLAAYSIAMALPNQWESFATILVQPQTVSKELVQAGVGETNLTERLGIMTSQILSRPRLSRIIDDLGLYPEESKRMLREEIIDLMRNAVRVEPLIPELEKKVQARSGEAEINTFRIFFRSQARGTAAAVAQRLANDFIDEQFKARSEVTQKSLDFMTAELNRLAGQIREVEAQVAQVKSANPGKLPEEMNANQTRAERIQSDIAYAQRTLADAISDEEFYRSQEFASEVKGSDADPTSPTRRIRLLELGLAEYAAKGYTRKHPDVVKAELELKAIRASLEAKVQERKAEEEASPERQSAVAETRRAEKRRLGAQQELERLQEAAGAVEALLAETPRVAEQLDGLEREYKHLFASYQDFSNRRLEATIQAQLERRQLGEQFRVLESAFEPPNPSSPNRVLIVLLGVFFGIALGGALGVVLEAADTSLHSARQLQATVNAPVLSSIPRIWLASDRAAARRRRLREALVTASVLFLVLGGGALNYARVNGAAGEASSSAAAPAPPAAAAALPAAAAAPAAADALAPLAAGGSTPADEPLE